MFYESVAIVGYDFWWCKMEIIYMKQLLYYIIILINENIKTFQYNLKGSLIYSEFDNTCNLVFFYLYNLLRSKI